MYLLFSNLMPYIHFQYFKKYFILLTNEKLLFTVQIYMQMHIFFDRNVSYKTPFLLF